LPLYVLSEEIDATTLGLIVAGWAIGRLIAEPPAGWWADSHSRKLQMVLSLLIVGCHGWEPLMPSVAATIEAGFSALLGTALFAMVASGSPHGRPSLTQGIYGSVGTSAIIVSAMVSGALWEVDSAYPFWFFAIGVGTTLVLGILVYTGFLGRFPRRGGGRLDPEMEAPAGL
jgi:MFS family permease